MGVTKQLPVMAVRESLVCNCGGEMKATGFSQLSMPPNHQHRCETCGAEEYHKESYPRIRHYPYDPQEWKGIWGTCAPQGAQDE